MDVLELQNNGKINMSKGRATIIGGTGMIGNYLIDILLADHSYEEICLLVRRPPEKLPPGVNFKLIDFRDTESFKLGIEGSEVVFCAVGTTKRKVEGDRSLYKQIDFDIPKNAARFCKETGCGKLIIVSSVGASSKSRSFYLRLKGQMEEAVASYKLRSVHIMQPSLLLGVRTEKRRGEKLLQNSMYFFSNYLFGGWRKYKAIHAGKVAAAMLNAAKKDDEGFFRYTYSGIIKLANANKTS
jgi:nucleoside-diphosphate-sugar epimerase